MRITRNQSSRPCAVCGRRLLMGEQFSRFMPAGGRELVEVCRLCNDTALAHGWVKEGAPTSPIPAGATKRRGMLASLFGISRQEVDEPVAADPVLRRLSEGDLLLVEAAEAFNASPFRRTIGGVARSLGQPRASIVQLSGILSELVITVAWDLSWYQYRVSLDAAQPVRLAERGHELHELDERSTSWNARVEEDGRIVPDAARIDALE